MTSGAGGWRVAIVDTADDMNDNAANALLKTAGRAAGARHAAAAGQHAGPACCRPSARAASGWICGRWTMRRWKRRWRDYLPDTTAAERASLARLVRRLASARRLTLASGEGGDTGRTKPTG